MAPDGEQHSCDGHTHGHPVSDRMLAAAVTLTLAFVIIEAIAGWLGHSLALLSDAGHNFADAAALGFSWYAVWVARKPANPDMTYGYHRVGILAALVNAVSLVVIALAIAFEAAQRLRHPEMPYGWLMAAVAAVALTVNLIISFWLHGGAAHDINVRSAYLHMLGDALSAVGVIAAGIIVALSGAKLADPIVSILIAALILWSSWGILCESVSVLLEASPKGLDMRKVETAIGNVDGVRACHDLHVWTVGPGAVACSVHVLVAEQSIRQGQQILRAVVEMLQRDFKINHTTVQVEVEGHGADEMYCSIEPVGGEHIGHHH